MESTQNQKDSKLKFLSILAPAQPLFYYDYDL